MSQPLKFIFNHTLKQWLIVKNKKKKKKKKGEEGNTKI